MQNESKPIKFPGLSLNKSFHEVFDEIQLKEKNGFVDGGKRIYYSYIKRLWFLTSSEICDSKDIEIANEFARKKNCKLVIIPDSLDNIHKYIIPENIKISTLARLFIQERIALYQNSIVNLFQILDQLMFLHLFMEQKQYYLNMVMVIQMTPCVIVLHFILKEFII